MVEIHSINNSPYKGTITPREARKTIFQDILGFSQDALIGCIIGYSRCRIVTYKLRDVFDIDTLHMIEDFTFERVAKDRMGGDSITTLSCRIRGIRRPGGGTSGSGESYRDEGIRWVKVEGCEYRIEQQQIKDWLAQFGELLSDIVEDTFEDESDDQESYPAIGNGIYSVQMKLVANLPQVVPMCGKRIRLYHRGISKLCSNCFGAHIRTVCKSEKVPWIQYVCKFITEHPTIPPEFYGKWYQAAEQWNTAASSLPSVPRVEKKGPEPEQNKDGKVLTETMVETMLASLRCLPQSIAAMAPLGARMKQKSAQVTKPDVPNKSDRNEEEKRTSNTREKIGGEAAAGLHDTRSKASNVDNQWVKVVNHLDKQGHSTALMQRTGVEIAGEESGKKSGNMDSQRGRVRRKNSLT